MVSEGLPVFSYRLHTGQQHPLSLSLSLRGWPTFKFPLNLSNRTENSDGTKWRVGLSVTARDRGALSLWTGLCARPWPDWRRAPRRRKDSFSAPVMGRAPVMTETELREQNRTDSESPEWVTDRHGASRSIFGPAVADVRGGHGD
jgi:hypothetical protein